TATRLDPADTPAWVEAARSGDPDAFGRLFDRWFDPVYDVAWRIVRNRETAAEVAQDVFLVAWQGLDGLAQPGSFGGWVRRIARNRALNRLDRERRSLPDDEQATAALDRSAPDVDMTAALGEQEQAELVWAAASALGERDASLLDLHLRHGFGAREIADELGVTANNAHQLLHRLKGKLGGAIRAWVLWRAAGGRRCPELERVIDGAGVSSFGAEAVRLIGRHAGGCDACTERQQLRLAPEALFAAMPVMIAPPALRAQAASALESAGVSMSGSTVTSTPGDGGAGTGQGAGAEGAGPSATDDTAVLDTEDAAVHAAPGGPDGGSVRSLLLRRPLVGGLAAAALLLVLGLGGLLWADRGGRDTERVAVADGPPVPDDRARVTAGDGTTTAPTEPPGTTDAPPTTPGDAQPTTPPTPPPTTAPPTTDPGTTRPTTTEPAVDPPVIDYFDVVPGNPCADRTTMFVSMRWSSTGADSAMLTTPDGTSRSVDTAGSDYIECAPAGEFVLTVTGPGGEDSARENVGNAPTLAAPTEAG
ncbi:MAG: RNA polymerase sigma factor, partial [Acidimicrobiia bacterium]